MLTPGFPSACNKALSSSEKKLISSDGPVSDRVRPGHPVQSSQSRGNVVQRGQMGQVAPVAPEHDLLQVDQSGPLVSCREKAPHLRSSKTPW
jgi:hypothetical protein